MKLSTNKKTVNRMCFLLAMLVAVGVQADPVKETPAELQSNNALRRQHQKAEQVLIYASTQSAGQGLQLASNRMASKASSNSNSNSNSLGVIDLPGTAKNNAQLSAALNLARTQMTAMKTAKQPAKYTQQQQKASTALDTVVNSYIASRAAAKIPLGASTNNNDHFLQEMAALKMALMQNSLNAEALDSMLSRLLVARNTLVTLSATAR